MSSISCTVTEYIKGNMAILAVKLFRIDSRFKFIESLLNFLSKANNVCVLIVHYEIQTFCQNDVRVITVQLMQ